MKNGDREARPPRNSVRRPLRPPAQGSPLHRRASPQHGGAPPARRSSPPPHGGARLRRSSGPAHTPVLLVTAPFLRVQLFHTSCPVADCSHRRSLGTPCVPPASLPPDSTPGPQPQFPRTLGQTRILAFCSHCWSPPHHPPEQGPGCPFPLPSACSWEPAHSQARAMVTHPESGVFGNISDLDTQGRNPSPR